MLLGLSAGIKIWNVVVCLVVVLHTVAAQGWRRGLRLAFGVLAGVTAVCLPFLLLSGPVMWRMVVLDQLARGGSDAPLWRRASDILGLSAWQPNLTGWTPVTVAVAAAVVACCALACRVALGRLSVALLVAATALLMATPSWYLHYAGLAAAPLALTVGAAVPALLRRPSAQWASVAIAAVVTLTAVWAAPGLTRPFGRPFPAAELAASVQHQQGCVTSDDPTTLIELGVFDRNLRRHCPVVIDLTGYSYDLRDPTGPRLTRRANTAWQQHVLGYLGGGTTSVVVRLSHAFSLSARTARALRRWPVVAAADGFAVRRPAS